VDVTPRGSLWRSHEQRRRALRFFAPWTARVCSTCSNPAYQPLDTTADRVFLADELRFTRDPFDGLICAAAPSLGLPLVTRDGAIHDSGAVKTLC
jgi:PIN domain nuclease of toxin-antitoxin system